MSRYLFFAQTNVNDWVFRSLFLYGLITRHNALLLGIMSIYLPTLLIYIRSCMNKASTCSVSTPRSTPPLYFLGQSDQKIPH
ncbi:hypothetical protein CPB86DRAFT_226629 [Serendipita vermifera]|nr:hypothetical protein CPB86DRAFT_226629 [Serendipita vermifera]